MPDVSKAQFRFTHMINANPKMARKLGMSSKVAADFVAADKKSGVKYKDLPEKKPK